MGYLYYYKFQPLPAPAVWIQFVYRKWILNGVLERYFFIIHLHKTYMQTYVYTYVCTYAYINTYNKVHS